MLITSPIGQLLAKLPDISKSSTGVVLTPAESADKTVPIETSQATQLYGGLAQDSRQKQKKT